MFGSASSGEVGEAFEDGTGCPTEVTLNLRAFDDGACALELFGRSGETSVLAFTGDCRARLRATRTITKTKATSRLTKIARATGANLFIVLVAHQIMKPRSGLAKRLRFGKTVGISVALTPNHFASVAEYSSTDVVGIHRPSSVS